MASIELRPSERGKVWYCQGRMLIDTRYGTVSIFDGFKFNRETTVPNLPDQTPSMLHDFGYTHHIKWDGMPLSRLQWDQIYYDACKKSRSKVTRWIGCSLYAFGLRLFGRKHWHKAAPIPDEHRSEYGHTPFN